MTTVPATQYKGHAVHVVHVTDIRQTIDGHDEVSRMAKIYFTDETQDDAYYVPADEVSGLADAEGFGRWSVDEITDSIDRLVKQRRVGSARFDIAELQALLDELHSRALEEDQAQADDSVCLGHESLNGAHMGQSVFCDGSCS